MTTATDFAALQRVVESIRQQLHPNVDKQFLEDVIDAEENNPEDDATALKAIADAADRVGTPAAAS